MEAIKTLFFIFLFLTFYSFFVYPVILSLLGCIIRKQVHGNTCTPPVTLIISAYNEESVIARKIENSLKLDYPRNLLEIMIVSDHSTDRTDSIVREYIGNGITLLSQPERSGKTAGLNGAVKRASGEILVFSDADAMYEPGAIKKMVNLLGDERVGLVTGSTRYIAETDGDMVETSSIYTDLERFIKRNESRVGSCVGADGAIFAMRKSLYQPLRSDDINDFVLPLTVVKSGYRVVLHDDLYCSEAASSDAGSEFQRQVRITNRTLRALFRNSELMNFFKFPFFSFELISHKLVRLGVPVFMVALIPLNALLVGEGLYYKVMMIGQGTFYGAALFAHICESYGRKRVLSMIYHFVFINISVLIGWRNYISGVKQITWNTK